MPDTVYTDRLRADLAKYEKARDTYAAQLEHLERTKAQVLAQLNACAGAVEALRNVLPSEAPPSDTDPSSGSAVPTDGAASEPTEATS